MVKGNFERRKELAEKRKEDRKAEVERKKAGAALATPVEVRGRLLHDAKVAGATDDLLAWVAAPASDDDQTRKDVCDSWWRTGFCALKRCRLSHEESISHLRGVPESACVDAGSLSSGSGSEGQKKKGKRGKKGRAGGDTKGGGIVGAALPPMVCLPLEAVDAGGQLAYDRNLRTQRRKESLLMFVALRGELVFDKANPDVFAKYAGVRPAEPGVAGMRAELPTSRFRARSPTAMLQHLSGCRTVSAERSGPLRPRGPLAGSSPRRAPSPWLVNLGRRNVDWLVQRPLSPAACTRANSVPLRRAQSPSTSVSAEAAAAMWHVSEPTLCCRRCGNVTFGSVEALRAHFKEMHARHTK